MNKEEFIDQLRKEYKDLCAQEQYSKELTQTYLKEIERRSEADSKLLTFVDMLLLSIIAGVIITGFCLAIVGNM